MKKFLFFLFISINTFSQEHNFVLENAEVKWEKIYDVSETKKEDVLDKVKSFCLSNISYNNLQLTDDTITFQVNSDVFNLKKYGKKKFNSSMIYFYEYNYLTTIEFKDNKYKVTLRDIKIIDNKTGYGLNSTFTDYFTKKKGTQFKDNSEAKDGLSLFNLHFSDKFNIQNTELKKSDW